jgi:hypothetical protein
LSLALPDSRSPNSLVRDVSNDSAFMICCLLVAAENAADTYS